MKGNQLFSFSSMNDENSSKWNKDFFESYKNGNKQEIMNLLSQADELYLDEFYIYNCISKLNSSDITTSEKDDVLKGLKKCNIVRDVVNSDNTISIKINNNKPINISKLSDILSEVSLDKHSKDELIRQSRYSAEYISQLLSFPNSVVTGYVYGIADKAKSLYTWVEFKNNKKQEFVIDYASNTVFNKDSFYYIRHAEPLKKVSSDDIKGKSSVGKFISFNSANTIEEPDIEVEFDIDFDR